MLDARHAGVRGMGRRRSGGIRWLEKEPRKGAKGNRLNETVSFLDSIVHADVRAGEFGGSKWAEREEQWYS